MPEHSNQRRQLEQLLGISQDGGSMDVCPTLLPHLVGAATDQSLDFICSLANRFSRGAPFPPWPALGEATFSRVAGRIREPMQTERLLKQYPALVSHIDTDSLPPDLSRDALYLSDYQSPTEMLVRMAARFPADHTIVSHAFEAVDTSYDYDRLSALGYLGRASNEQERDGILQEMLDGNVHAYAVYEFLPALDHQDRKRLVDHLCETLARSDPVMELIELAYLLPRFVDEQEGQRLLERIVALNLEELLHWLPVWYVSLVMARIARLGPAGCRTNLQLLENMRLHGVLETIWGQHLQSLADPGSLPEGEFGDVLAAQPGATLLATDMARRLITPDRVPGILNNMVEHWGGAGPPKEKAVAGPAPDVEEDIHPSDLGGLSRPTSVDILSDSDSDRATADEEKYWATGNAGANRDWGTTTFSAPAASAPAAAPEPAGEGGEARVVDERRVHAQLRYGDEKAEAFLAGREMVVRCWIGLKDILAGTPASGPIPTVPIPDAGLTLDVIFLYQGERQAGRIILPESRSARSGDCDFTLMVPADTTEISMDIAFLYKGRAFEYVTLTGSVCQPGEESQEFQKPRLKVQLDRRQVIELTDRTAYDGTIICDVTSHGGEAQAHIVAFGDRNSGHCYLSAGDTLEFLNKKLFTVQQGLVRAQATDADRDDVKLAANDENVLHLLRYFARHGATLYSKLVDQGFEDPGEHIQIQNRTADADYIPLEFVYDGGRPTDNAKLCGGWEAALEPGASECPVCSQRDPGSIDRTRVSTICPFSFWALQKVIERPAPPAAGNGSFPSGPTDARRRLPALERIVYASSQRVNEADRAALRTYVESGFSSNDSAEDWITWSEKVELTGPQLLLALPHQGKTAIESYLEIGPKIESADPGSEIQRLFMSQLSEGDYINPARVAPGPIVLLLGCETGAEDESSDENFTEKVQRQHAAITLGTQSMVLGRHAVPLAVELIRQLLAIDRDDADFGTIMRSVRRRMFYRGNLLALSLIALGDADWYLGTRSGQGNV